MFNFLRKIGALFSDSRTGDPGSNTPNLNEIIKKIRERESEAEQLPGRRIHRFEYLRYELQLDLDITETYRVQVIERQERVFSFSIYCKVGEYKTLEAAFEQIFRFLEGQQHLADLPDNEYVKGFYYGRG